MQMPASRTLPHLLEELAARFPDRNFVTDGSVRLSYPGFLARARNLARSFHALGVRKGDRVGLLMGNQVEWLEVEFAVLMLGGVLVHLNTWWRADELKHALTLTDASVLVMVDRYLGNDYTATLEQLGDLRSGLPDLKHVVCLGANRPGIAIDWADFVDGGKGTDDAAIVDAMSQVFPEDDAAILFTSGSTARSKGVPLQHRGLVENMFGIGQRMHLTEKDRLLLVVSLFWGYGVNGLFAFMTHGASVVLQHHHDPTETLRLIEEERCTAIYATPNLVHALHGHPDRKTRDLRSLRTGLARNSVVHLLDEMGAHEVSTMYGLTEGYANSTVTDGRLPLELRRRISGHALPNTDVQVVDPASHKPLDAGQPGELRIRGYVSRGYLKNPQLTAEATDADGWFYTGDLATLDRDGGLEIKGRLKELIKTGGISVTPADVEYLLLQVPGVVQALVVGVPDKERDEIVAAAVVLAEGASVTKQDLLEHCRKSAAAYKVPRLIEFMTADEIPVTHTGKPHKQQLQALLAGKHRSPVAGIA